MFLLAFSARCQAVGKCLEISVLWPCSLVIITNLNFKQLVVDSSALEIDVFRGKLPFA